MSIEAIRRRSRKKWDGSLASLQRMYDQAVLDRQSLLVIVDDEKIAARKVQATLDDLKGRVETHREWCERRNGQGRSLGPGVPLVAFKKHIDDPHLPHLHREAVDREAVADSKAVS